MVNAATRKAVAAVLKGGIIVGGLMGLAAVAQAQTAPAADESLTWHGITLYGIVDIGLQFDTNAAPISDFFPAGSNDIIQSNGNGSVTGLTPNNLSQSRIGLKGTEPLTGGWSAVFKVETYFNPQSGDISDALKSLTLNNGKAAAAQTTGIDSSVAGQLFSQAFVGVSSPVSGTLTFGRQNTLFADAVAKYDPQGASQAFSLIGLSGTTAGGGDTQDRRLDNSVKYVAMFGNVHLGANYKFKQSGGGAGNAAELQVGGEYGGLSIDAYYINVNDAVSVKALSAAQLTTAVAAGYSSTNALSGTISDNTSYALVGSYSFGAPKIFAGYDHIQYANPSTPLAAGYIDIGGYVLAAVSNAAYANDKVLQVYWAGLKYAATPKWELTLAYYGYRQNSFVTGADAGCKSTISSGCSGSLDSLSVSAVHHFTKRFDVYAGAMYTEVQNGLASGYLNSSNIDPTIGVRYQF
ncbi:MAG TPA: porin [Steroidobacteraceae bacterium]|nr:porin [Steroidobacteraceae bacterium]